MCAGAQSHSGADATGLSAARARGRLGGRRKVLDPVKRKLAIQLYREKNHSIAQICQMMGISHQTLYNYLGEDAEKTDVTK